MALLDTFPRNLCGSKSVGLRRLSLWISSPTFPPSFMHCLLVLWFTLWKNQLEMLRPHGSADEDLGLCFLISPPRILNLQASQTALIFMQDILFLGYRVHKLTLNILPFHTYSHSLMKNIPHTPGCREQLSAVT